MRLAAVCVWLLVALAAKAGSPSFTGISPVGGQLGTEIDVICAGQHLADAKTLLFYTPGFEVSNVQAVDDKTMKAHLKIAADCALGEHPVRLVTGSGLSELRTFWVGPFPTVEEKEPNNDAAHAQAIPLNVTATGVTPGEDVDYFSVELKKDQRLSVEVEGLRLGNAMFDPLVTISKSNGEALATCDDSALFLQDPIAQIIAPEDGVYLIAIRESTYGGNDQCKYRMHVGTFPRPAAVFPSGGKAGEEVQLNFLGDVRGQFASTVKLPTENSENFALLAEQDGERAPSPNAFRISNFPNVLETEPNNDVAHATATEAPLPIAFNGVIGEKEDVDFFRFKAKKDESFDVNVFARRMRSRLDSVVTIYNAEGHSIGGNDDAGGPDSYLRFKAPADGEFCVSVRDQLGRGGPLFVYRIEITPVVSDVELTIPQPVQNSQERQTIVVPRGNRYATMVRAKRSDFGGGLALASNDLPVGITMHAEPFAANADMTPVVFEATSDAVPGAKLCELQAQPTEPEKQARAHFEQPVDLVLSNPNNTSFCKTQVAKLAMAVADEAPFSITVVEPKVPLIQNGSMNLKVMLTRKEGFNGAVNVAMLYNPQGIGSQSAVTIPAGQTEAMMPLSASGDAPVRKWTIALIGSGDAGKETIWTSTQLAALEVAAPFVTASIEMTKLEQGQSGAVVCKLAQRNPFDGKAKVQLLGLPTKVTAPEMEISAGDAEVKFQVSTEKASPAGQHRALFCQFTISKNGETMVYNSGQGGVLRIDPPQKLAEKK